MITPEDFQYWANQIKIRSQERINDSRENRIRLRTNPRIYPWFEFILDPRDTEAIDSIISIIKEHLNSIPEEFRYELQQVMLDGLDRIRNRMNTD
ncbi:MAG TPA: hypothetical protein VHJ38_12465 [Nitrososphaeraceae archaeon]|jgi:hypothetical protein|nr:hypothetical protein [Nitrososphaeraceae archaeon]